MNALEVRVLGSVEIWSAGRRLDCGPPQRRAVIAALAADVGGAVPAETLIDRVWGDAPPARVRAAIHANISLIRRVLEEAHGAAGGQVRLALRAGGYVLQVEPEWVDLYRFRRLVASARDERLPDPDRAGLLREALDLWRGPVMADLPGAWPARMRDSVGLERLDAAVGWARTELRVGRPEGLIGPVRALVADYPLAEPLTAVLMRALAATGRVAEALDCYAATRARLADDLGSEPGTELRDLHRALLRGEVNGLAGKPAPEPPPGTAPAQLPMDAPGFTGRVAEMAHLDAVLTAADTEPTAVFISAIAGTAGVGKTALAVHWAHRVRDQFPDGQLYVNLRGYAAAAPMRPLDALAGFLRALDVPSEQVPVDEEDAAARYRSVLAGRRLLVLLDNARDAEQVRPLLPGSAGCLVLVTSRDRLGGLTVHEGAQPITLDTLRPGEAHALLARLVGLDRVDNEPAAAAQLARACAYLPLALRIAAAALVDDPRRTIAAYVAELAAGNRLDALAVDGDEGTAVRATFDLSYQALTPPAQRLFRLLGLVPGPDFTADVAAALTGTAATAARPLLDRLVAAHLADQRRAGRYSFHDLLRAHAAELAHRLDPAADRRAAVHRMLGHYLHTAYAARDLVYPEKFALPPAADHQPPSSVRRFDAPAQALAWFDAERPNLIAAIQHAAEHGPRPAAWRLADVLRIYFWLRTPMVDWLATAQSALAAARAENDLPGQVVAELSLGDAHRCQSRYPRAIEHYSRAAVLARDGWPGAMGPVSTNLGNAYLESGQLSKAAERYSEALAIARREDRLVGQATCLGHLGLVYLQQGRLTRAADRHAEALALHRRMGSRIGVALGLGSLGETYRALGRLEGAHEHITEALDRYRELGDRGAEAEHLRVLAEVHRDAGHYAQARESADTALSLARELGERRYAADALNTLATIHQRVGGHATAADQHREALHLARAAETLHAEVVALVGLAEVYRSEHLRDRARACARDALTLARERGYRLLEGQAHTALAGVHLDDGRADQAAEHAEHAVAIQSETGHRLGQAHALLILGRVHDRTATHAAAVAHWEQALSLLTDIGAPEAEAARNLLDDGTD